LVEQKPLDQFDCNRYNPDFYQPWTHLFCYYRHNSPYLGKFYPQGNTVTKPEEFQRKLKQKKYVQDFKHVHVTRKDEDIIYKYGTNIIKKSTSGAQEDMILPIGLSDDQMGYCSRRTPVKYLVDQNSECFQMVTQENCETNEFLSLTKYLVKGVNSEAPFPSVMSNYPSESIEASISVHCLENALARLHSSKNILKIIRQINKNVTRVDCKNSIFKPHFNPKSKMCENVVVSVSYDFQWNGTSPTRLQAKFELANIPVSMNSSIFIDQDTYQFTESKINKKSPNIMYVKQSFGVHFEHKYFNHTSNPEKKNKFSKGYKLNDKLVLSSNK
jgi:hypothetical protein